MNEPGPFDRMLGGASNRGGGRPRDPSARNILIGMGVVGLILLVLVLPPISLLSGGDDNGGGGGLMSAGSAGTVNGVKLPRVPEGFEALSRLASLEKPKDTNGPYALTIDLAQPATDARNIGLYTSNGGKWERVANATLVNNGTAATGQVGEMPKNVAVLRRTTSAAAVSGWLPAGSQIDAAALDVLATIGPRDFFPNADGSLGGTATQLPATKGNVMPVISATAPTEMDAVATIIASPALRDAHINALVAIAQQPGNAGIELDYRGVATARKADYNTFITALADRLHQASKSLAVTLPTPVKAGVSWDTAGYDWEEIARRADTLKLLAEQDPSVYFARMEEALAFLKPKIDLKKVVLVVTRQSFEKGTDGLRAMTLREGLTLASTMEVRSSQITPNSSVVIVGKNLYQDDGASGIHWDDNAFAVSFSYPGRGGQRTVWLENSLSVAFRVDLAKRYGLGGVSVDDVSANPQAAAVWDPLRVYAETGSVNLVAANSALLKPAWKAQAGDTEPGAKGNVIWKAPAQPGSYDVSLIVSDGVIRASQKIILEVKAAGTTGATGTATPRPTATPVR